MSIILWILIGIFLLILFSGAYVFVLACMRRKELPWMVEEELKKTSYGKYYNCIIASDEWLKSHNAEDVYMTSKDGLRLHAYWIPAQNPRGTILLAHGYRSTMLVDFGLAYAFYHALGMNILVPHQRAHGESEGRYITFGVKESDDFLRWIHYHNETFGKYQMILSGMSMGASTVLYLADRNLPENVKCIIADCGFTSPKAILDKVFREVTHLPSGPSLWAADLFARVLAGFRLEEKDTRQVLKNARLPVLMVHGLSDDFVPSSMTQQGYDACGGHKEILMVEGAGHGVSFLVDKQTYTKRIITFLEKYLEDF
ncbi:MAG: alpha/beta hydrolase [Oscillospiraceae bacterium]|nr:alpha/beta hydrolase [Oscillospiraceae bacterium]